MPVTIKTNKMKYKSDLLHKYVGINGVAERTTAELVEDLQGAGDDVMAEIDAKIAAGQAAIDGIESQKNQMIASIAQVAGQGTDETFTQQGVAADAKAVGDLKSGLVESVSDTIKVLLSLEFVVGDGSINSSGQSASNTKRARTGAISLEQNKTYFIHFDGVGVIKILRGCLYTGTAFNTYVSTVTQIDDYNLVFHTTSTAVYFRMAFWGDDSEVLDDDDFAAIYNAVHIYQFTDNSLSISGVPADSKKVGDMFSIDAITGWSNMADKHYIVTNTDTVDITDIQTSDDRIQYVVVDASENDIFIINGYGAKTARLWCFIDSNGNSLIKSENNATGTDTMIIAPANSSKLIIQNRAENPKTSYKINKTKYIGKLLDLLQTKIEKKGILSKGYSCGKPVIIDTDFTADVDDCVALRIACWAMDNNILSVKAIVTDCYTDITTPTVDAFMTYYGYPGIPMGWDTGKRVTRTSPYQADLVNMAYHRHEITSEYEDAVKVYRRELAKAPEKITIISIGYLGNLMNLLQSSADGYSSMTGMELVSAKVDKIYIMGGDWPVQDYEEGNFRRDWTAARYVINNCPVHMVLLGYDVGKNILTGQNLKDIYASPDDDMVYKAYYDYGKNIVTNGRSSWDQMLTYLAIIGNAAQCGYTETFGTASITENNVCTFTEGPDGNASYVTRSKSNSYYVNQINSKIF